MEYSDNKNQHKALHYRMNKQGFRGTTCHSL